MPLLPALCDTCGTPFSSGIFAENVQSLTFERVTAGPCPRCGGKGSIPSGTIDVLDGVIRVLRATEVSIVQRRRLESILAEARARAQPASELADRIEREVPGLARIGSEFRRAPVGTTAALVGMILAAIPLLRDANPTTDAVINETVNNYVTALPQVPKKREGPKIGRNDKCPCNSGKKFKRCCGARR